MALKIAAVSRDPALRFELARAFDGAPIAWQVALYEDVPLDSDVVVVGPDVEGVAGIAFDPSDPSAMLHAIERAASERTSHAIVVTGAGGGTGVTSVALHLAAASARRGARTCYVEAGGPRGARTRLGLPLITGSRVPEETEARPLPVPGGFRVLLGADAESNAVERAGGSFDRVVIDSPPGSAVPHVGAGVLVVTATKTSLERARLALVRSSGVPWAIVVNRLGRGGEATAKDLEHDLERRIALELPHSPALRDAEDDGRLLTSPLYGWTRAIERLWSALERA